MAVHPIKKTRMALLSMTALAVTAASIAPAYADRGRRGDHPRYDHHDRHYDRHHRRHHRKGGVSGGEAALIAAGVLGGLIILDQATRERTYRDDGYDRDYDDPYRYDGDDYRAYDYEERRYGGDDYELERRQLEVERRALEMEREALEEERRRLIEENGYDDEALPDSEFLDDELLGGADPAAIEAAYSYCAAQLRTYAARGRVTVALPAAPGDSERLSDGRYRITTSFTASEREGPITRTMNCEADLYGVHRLEII